MNTKIKVLFVCLGNICRSPMTHAVFLKMIEEENLQNIVEIDSVATSSYEVGNNTHIKTRQKLLENNISFNHIARQITKKDLEADYIIAMDDSNVEDIYSFAKDKKIHVYKLLNFANSNKDIQDPWYTDDFETTYNEVLKGCKGLVEEIKRSIISSKI